MARFDDYATKYQTVRMERRDGILQMTFRLEPSRSPFPRAGGRSLSRRGRGAMKMTNAAVNQG